MMMEGEHMDRRNRRKAQAEAKAQSKRLDAAAVNRMFKGRSPVTMVVDERKVLELTLRVDVVEADNVHPLIATAHAAPQTDEPLALRMLGRSVEIFLRAMTKRRERCECCNREVAAEPAPALIVVRANIEAAIGVSAICASCRAARTDKEIVDLACRRWKQGFESGGIAIVDNAALNQSTRLGDEDVSRHERRARAKQASSEGVVVVSVTKHGGRAITGPIKDRREALGLAQFASEVDEMLRVSMDIEIGGCLTHAAQLRVLATSPCNDFVLCERIKPGKRRSCGIGLFRARKGLTEIWVFQFDGHDIALCESSQHLEATFPEIYQWAIEALRNASGSQMATYSEWLAENPNWESVVKSARKSEQTTFEPSAVLPDDEGVAFVTDVPDAPLRVIGRLSRDGKWYIGLVRIVPAQEDREQLQVSLELGAAHGLIVLRDEPVAERIVRQAIRQLLSRRAEIHGEEAAAQYDAFLNRLRKSRFNLLELN
jgi:hypothetical protein